MPMEQFRRRTKIIATLGPATDDIEVLRRLIKAGVNVVRLNFSHGTQEQHGKRMELVRQVAQEMDRVIGILADMQGPKIRVSSFKSRKVELIPGREFVDRKIT